PIVHNYYYLLLLPVVMGLLEWAWLGAHVHHPRWTVLGILGVFMLVDLLARMPGLGPWLRDNGIVLLTLAAVMATAGFVLWANSPKFTFESRVLSQQRCAHPG